MMRLCLATDSREPSGVGEHMLALADAFRDRFAVVLACPESPGGAALLARAARLGVGVKRLDDEGATGRWLARAGLDLLHIHAGIGWEGHGLARTGRAAGVPRIVRTEHLPDLVTDLDQRRDYEAGLTLVDRVICVSEAAAATFRQTAGDAAKLVVVRNGHPAPVPVRSRDAVRADLGVTGDAPVLLTVARFTEQKDHATLIAALPAVLARHRDAQLWLAGTGPLEEAVRRQADAIGVAAAVRFLGQRGDVADLLAAANLFVLPSRFEGLPLAVLEAMAAGVPVVATAVGGTDEAVRDGITGLLVPPGDPDALADAILATLAPRVAARFGAAGRLRYGESFTAARMARDTALVYRDLLFGPSQRASHTDTVAHPALPAGKAIAPGHLHRHCEERSDATIHEPVERPHGLPRFARNDVLTGRRARHPLRSPNLKGERSGLEASGAMWEDDRGWPRSDRMTRTRLGFIGAGGIAHRHMGVLEQFDDVAIVAFADPAEERAREAAERFGATAYDDLDTMLAREDLDALYICVPPFAHGAPERAAIARKLPFFVEKPVAIDLAVAEAVAAAVADAGLVTGVGYHWRYLDTLDEAKALLADNPAQFLSGYWLDSTPPPPWWWKQAGSGGQMNEQTTHIVDLARALVGDVVQVFGLTGHTPRGDFPGLDVATVSTASLKFASGAVANIGATCLLRWNHRIGLHVFADGLAMEITDHDIMVDVGRGRPYRGAEGDPVWREDRDFIDAVQGHENRIRCPYAEALKTLRITDAIRRSAETGQAVTLAPAAETPAREPAHV